MTPRERTERVLAAGLESGNTLLAGLIEQAIVAAVLEEREACALVADDLSMQFSSTTSMAIALEVAEAIRARSQPTGLVGGGGGAEPAD